MFRCTWIHPPRDLPLTARLYRRTYARTYGRRPCDADQPATLPQDLRLSEAPTGLVPTGDSGIAANHIHQAA